MPQSEYFTLEALYHFQKLNKEPSGAFVSKLAKKMNVASSATSRLLHSLEEKGWILREVDKNDRRNTYVKLTEKGSFVREETSERLNVFFDGVVRKMGEEEIRSLIKSWNTLADTVALELNQTAESYIKKKDIQRKEYYRFFAEKDWGKMENYDLCLNTTSFGYQGCADIIAGIYRN